MLFRSGVAASDVYWVVTLASCTVVSVSLRLTVAAWTISKPPA